MTAAYFEDHPTDPNKVILRKRPCPHCNDTPRTWVGLTDEEVDECYYWKGRQWTTDELVRHVEAKLREKNNG